MATYKNFLDEIESEISDLPLGSLQMVGAMIAAQPQYGKDFIKWMIGMIETRTAISESSPIVLAAMRIYICAECLPREDAISFCMPDFALIAATGKASDLKVAVSFLSKVTAKYIELDS